MAAAISAPKDRPVSGKDSIKEVYLRLRLPHVVLRYQEKLQDLANMLFKYIVVRRGGRRSVR